MVNLRIGGRLALCILGMLIAIAIDSAPTLRRMAGINARMAEVVNQRVRRARLITRQRPFRSRHRSQLQLLPGAVRRLPFGLLSAMRMR